ncbi:MAG: CHAT domain-containing protein [Desulfobacterales bacterium]|nr:CHAT domain-containing protein [Desulfobacterales bacterium]
MESFSIQKRFQYAQQLENENKNPQAVEIYDQIFNECRVTQQSRQMAEAYLKSVELRLNYIPFPCDLPEITEFQKIEHDLKNHYPDSLILARIYDKLGSYCFEKGDSKDTRDLYFRYEAAKIYREKEQYDYVIPALISIHDSQIRHLYPKHIQLELLEEAEKLCRKHGNNSNPINPITVTVLFGQTGMEQQLNQEHGSNNQLADILCRKFNTLRLSGENFKAEKCFEDYMKIFPPPRTGINLTMWANYGNLLQNISSNPAAYEFLKERKKSIQESFYDNFSLSGFYMMLGYSYCDTKAPDAHQKQINYFEMAEEYYKKSINNSIISQGHLPKIYRLRGEIEGRYIKVSEAVFFFKKAEKFYLPLAEKSLEYKQELIKLYDEWYKLVQDETLNKKRTELADELEVYGIYTKTEYYFRNGDYERTLKFLDELERYYKNHPFLKDTRIKRDILERNILCCRNLAFDKSELANKGLKACEEFETLIQNNKELLSSYQVKRFHLEKLFLEDYSVSHKISQNGNNGEDISVSRQLFEKYKNMLEYFRNEIFIATRIYYRMISISELLDDDEIRQNTYQQYDIKSLSQTVQFRSMLPGLMYEEAEIHLKNDRKELALQRIKEAIAIIEQIRETIISMPFRSEFTTRWKKVFELGTFILLENKQYAEALDVYERGCSRRLLDEVANYEAQDTLYPKEKSFGLRTIQNDMKNISRQIQQQSHIMGTRKSIDETNEVLRKCESLEKITDMMWEELYEDHPAFFAIKQAPVMPFKNMFKYLRKVFNNIEQDVLLIRYAEFKDEAGVFVIDISKSYDEALIYIKLDYKDIKQKIEVLDEYIRDFQQLFEDLEDSNRNLQYTALIEEDEYLENEIEELQDRTDTINKQLVCLEPESQESEPQRSILNKQLIELQEEIKEINKRQKEIYADLEINSHHEIIRLRQNIIEEQEIQERNRKQIYEQICEMENSYDIQPTLASLYKLLWKPLKPFISDKIKDIYLFPTKTIASLPFYALYDKPQKQHLIDKNFTITLNYSLNTLPYVLYRRKQIKGGALLIAPDPLLNKSSVSEFKAFEKVSPNQFQPLIENNANLEIIRELAPYAAWIHFTAHGELKFRDPFSSYINLGYKEKLSIWEIYKSTQLSNNILTNLSSCFSAKPVTDRHDEMLSMVRGFLFAGSPCIIGSLWAVETNRTNAIMESFYYGLKEAIGSGNFNISYILKNCMKKISQKYPCFYYWAAFQLYGDIYGIGNKVDLPLFSDFQMKIDYEKASSLLKEYEEDIMKTEKGTRLVFNRLLNVFRVINVEYMVDIKLVFGKQILIEKTDELALIEKVGNKFQGMVEPANNRVAVENKKIMDSKYNYKHKHKKTQTTHHFIDSRHTNFKKIAETKTCLLFKSGRKAEIFITDKNRKILGRLNQQNSELMGPDGELFSFNGKEINVYPAKKIGESKTGLLIKSRRKGEILITDRTGKILKILNPQHTEFTAPSGEKFHLKGNHVSWSYKKTPQKILNRQKGTGFTIRLKSAEK